MFCNISKQEEFHQRGLIIIKRNYGAVAYPLGIFTKKQHRMWLPVLLLLLIVVLIWTDIPTMTDAGGRCSMNNCDNVIDGGGVTLPVFHGGRSIPGVLKQSNHATHNPAFPATNGTHVALPISFTDAPNGSHVSTATDGRGGGNFSGSFNGIAQLASTMRADRLQFPLVTLDQGFGEYFAVMKIGTPPQVAAVAIDTGSQLLWVQCQPCLQCGHQAEGYPVYDPAKSTTYQSVSCDECDGDASVATLCTGGATKPAQAGAAPHHLLAQKSDHCIYGVTYGDRSNSTGYLSKETLSIESSRPGMGVNAENVKFGCGLINTGLVSTLNASGLLGLDRGKYSLVSQLGIKTFSYCLPNHIDAGGNGGASAAAGFLTLGPTTAAAASRLQYTPLLQNTQSEFLSQFYFLNLTGISVGGRMLSIPASSFRATASGEGGTIIDSGTTISSFVHEAYMALYDAFDAAIDASITRIDLGNQASGLHLCYQVPLWQQTPPSPPVVTLHLAGPVHLHLQAHHVLAFLGSDSSYNYYCMAFMDSGSDASAANYIGNYQQQDLLVEYDLLNSRIGFAATKCSRANQHFALQSSWSRLALYILAATTLIFNIT